jgi:hypothetical protein
MIEEASKRRSRRPRDWNFIEEENLTLEETNISFCKR